MTSKLTLAGLFAVAAIGAAGVGGYLALRHNAAELPAAPAVNAPATVPPGDAPAAADPVPSAAPATDAPKTARPAVSQPQPRPTAVATPARPESATDVAPAPVMAPPPPAVPSTPPAEPVTTAVAPPVDAPAPVPPATPPTRYDQVTIGDDAVLGLRLDSTLSSETARPEDTVHARLSRDVIVDGRVAVAQGARLEGAVVSVERGGKFKDRPRIGFTFHTMVLADNTRVAIRTETIYREGDSPTGQANAKIGGSGVVGAILGGLIGGKKGAIVGSAVGAAGGAASVAAGDRPDVVVTAGTTLTVRLTQAVSILIERQH